MKTKTKPLTFEEIRHTAYVHGLKILDLAAMLAIHHPTEPDGPLGDYDAKGYKAIGETLMGIRLVLNIIASTPNVSVNREAQDAMEARVRDAGAIVSEAWVKDMLKDADKVLGRPEGG